VRPLRRSASEASSTASRILVSAYMTAKNAAIAALAAGGNIPLEAATVEQGRRTLAK
jgi:hypothetical protein